MNSSRPAISALRPPFPVLYVSGFPGEGLQKFGVFRPDQLLRKPFDSAELVARLRAVWRRASGDGLSLLTVGNLKANLMTREVTRGDRAIELELADGRWVSLRDTLLPNGWIVGVRRDITEAKKAEAMRICSAT